MKTIKSLIHTVSHKQQMSNLKFHQSHILPNLHSFNLTLFQFTVFQSDILLF